MWKTILIIASILIIGLIMFNIFAKESSGLDISVEEFKEKRTETPGVIIDVRTQGEFEDGHLADVDHQFDLMNGDFEAQLDNLDKDKTYYLYCRSGNRSGQAARMMKQNGFDKVYNIGGYGELANSGLETK